MSKWRTFECPVCREPILYEPSEKTAKLIRDTELTAGRACEVMIDCPHCPTSLLVSCDTGQARPFLDAKPDKAAFGGLFYDMTFTEKQKEKVAKLNEEGHNLMIADPRRAEAKFREAVALRKHDPQTWYNIGVCRFNSHGRAAAEECFRHALKYDPKLVQAWNNLGFLCLEQGRIDDAQEAFDQGIKAQPDYPKCYLGKANVCSARGNLAEARHQLQLALSKDSNYLPAKKFLAILDRMEG